MTKADHRVRARAVLAGKRLPLVMAHRGNSARCPENTLAAFRRAVEDGADAIETDLHVATDGAFMCIHDATLDRTTDGRGPVRERTRAELQALRASYGRAEYADERIPTLDELFAAIPAHVYVGLELKSDDFLAEAVCRRLANTLRALGASERAFALSFSHARLDAVRRYTPDVPTGLITLFRVIPPRAGLMTGPLWPVLFANPLYVWLAHRRGQLVCPLDVRPEPRLKYYRALGCDVVMTNDPGVTVRALGRVAPGA